MNASTTSPIEIIQIPSVVLSERAFKWAQNEGIIGIRPSTDAMRAIGEITMTGEEYIPDITVLRAAAPLGRRWDITFIDASPDLPYFPSSELSVQERKLQTVSAGDLRRSAYEASKMLVELTVRDWGTLGKVLAEVIEEAKTLKKGYPSHAPDKVVDALGQFASQLLGLPSLASPGQKRARAARNLQPYTIRHK